MEPEVANIDRFHGILFSRAAWLLIMMIMIMTMTLFRGKRLIKPMITFTDVWQFR
jgi:hypothetical protein